MNEPVLFDIPSHSVPDETAELLACIDGDRIHQRDRAVIVRAIIAEAHSAGGVVDPNRLRARLADANGHLTVFPKLVGAVVGTLARKGVLRADGWVTSTDRVGRNAGRPARRYRLVRLPSVAA